MINAYGSVNALTSTPRQINNNLLRTMIYNLKEYQDTSHTKVKRYEVLENTITILEFLTMDINSDLPQQEQDILFNGFLKILTKAKEASINRNMIYNFSYEIGFLNMLITL